MAKQARSAILRKLLFKDQPISALLFAGVLVALAQVISLNFASDKVLPSIWFTSGIALGLCFAYGKHMAYAVFAGTLAAQLFAQTSVSSNNAIAFSLFFAFCLALQTIAIYLSFGQKSEDKTPLSSARALFKFLGLSSFVCLVNAALIAMNQSVFFDNKPFTPDTTLCLFLSNLSGIVLFSPFLIALRFVPNPIIERKALTERVAWVTTALFLAYASIIFDENAVILFTPLIVWAASRFNLVECTLAIAISSFIVMPAFGALSITDSFNLTLWASNNVSQLVWLGIVATSLYFSSLILDKNSIELRLEQLVHQRTLDLHSANQELQDEVFVRQQAEKSFRTSSKRYRALIETTGIPIIVLDQNFCIKQWNRAAEELFGYAREEVLSKNFLDTFIPQENQDQMAWRFTKVLESGVSKQNMESKILSQSQEPLIMLWNMNLLSESDDDPQKNQLLLIGQNISEIRQTQDQLHYLAHFDALTGTANRRLFEDRCEQAIQSALRHKHQIGLIALDIDHFKRINDTLGHDVGDDLLVTLTSRLKNCIRREDTIARLGGDEFAILLANINGQEGAERVARSILDAITQPINTKGSELVITSSIGITVCPMDGTHYPDLLKNADMAMYRAKKAGRNNIQFYSPEMNEEMQRQLHIEQELRTALLQQQFEIYYQPIIDIETGEVVALEALLRWLHPLKGTLRPDYFLHVAEQTGQIHDIGKWMLETICQNGREIQMWSSNTLQIALNLSDRQYNHPGLVQMIKSVTDATQFNPRNLILEMSESTITANAEGTFSTLQKLHDLGVSLTIDGFGTGLSSLRQLKQTPIDIIKIDRSFVNGIPEDQNDMAITETLLAIASQMDLRTFATGIENKEQEAFLKINGCRYAQGYQYSAPLPFDKLPALFQNIRAGQLLSDAEQIFLPFEPEEEEKYKGSNVTKIKRN